MTYLLCSVHHIGVNPISTSPVRFSHLFTQTRKVGCENRGASFTARLSITKFLVVNKSQVVCVMPDRLSACSPVMFCLGSGRLKDALNGFIEQGVILGIGLLGRQPLYQRPREARYDAVIPAQAVVAFFP